VTIYNGIDPDELAPSADRERTRCTLGIEDDRPVVLFAAQLVAWKRPDLALEVFAKVRARRGDAQLWIAGSPPPGDETAADKLKTQATVLGIADAIRLLGHRPDMPDLFRAADVLLATARTEPLGRSVMEAMALGRPVVATAGGGHLELIEDGNSGILFDADAPQSAADRLLELLDDTEKARRLGEAARHRIASNFTVETMVEGVQELYDRLP
jgi:glycosyltransferase involved in cell wall biosynthesis